MGFEPTTHCWASDFESDRWPIRLPSEDELLQFNVRNAVSQADLIRGDIHAIPLFCEVAISLNRFEIMTRR